MGRLFDFWTLAGSQLIGIASPARAVRFIEHRRKLAAYQAATRKGPNQAWKPSNRTEDENLKRDSKLIVARARDIARNSPHVSGAIERIVNNVVYTGIRPQALFTKGDGSQKANVNDRIEAAWSVWADAVGFYEMQDLALRHQWHDGEVLAHLYVDEDLLRRGIIPLGVELIEADHLVDSIDGDLGGGRYARRGIEFDRRGRPEAYSVYTTHPGDSSLSASEYRRIPASEMIHVFLKRRVSQSRGVPWLTPILTTVRDFDEYQNSERVAARLASAFGVFVETPFMDGGLPLGGLDPNAAEGAQSVMSYIEPGRIQTLPPGMKISVAEHNRPGNSYEPFSKTTLKSVSAGVGMSYEALSNDYKEASYSSARSAALEERRGYSRQQEFINRRFNAPVWAAWCRFAYMLDVCPSVTAPVAWQVPGWDWVDPLKDAQAFQLLLQLGLTTKTAIAASRGDDLAEIRQTRAREIAEEKALGLDSALETPPAPTSQTQKEDANADSNT